MTDFPREVADRFRDAVAAMPADRDVLVLSHNDADGLSAAAILGRALARADRRTRTRILGRGENPWSPEMAAELRDDPAGGLLVADLGLRGAEVRAGTPTVILDHHVPTGTPPESTVITGHGREPTPTTSLLAYWAAGGIAPAEDLLWLAAIGIVGDMEEKSGFPEMAAAAKQYGVTAIRDAVSLINAPRRTGAGDHAPALALLMRCDGAKELLSGTHPETAALLAAKAEVKRALDEAKRVPPRVQGEVAIIKLHSDCQVHPLVAQSWRGRLADKVVLAANTGYRPGWVHFAARSADGRDLVDFLRQHRPEGAEDESYGNGHARASGGALRPPAWNAFVEGLGFGPEMRVPA